MGRRCVTKAQGEREEPWRGRRKVAERLLALDGDTRLERALVRWRLQDGSRTLLWTAVCDLRGRTRRNAKALWAQRYYQGQVVAAAGDDRLVELARGLGARRAAAQQRRRVEGREADDLEAQQVGGAGKRGVRAAIDADAAGGLAGAPPSRGERREQGTGEAMAIDAQSARADGGYGEARLPIDPSPLGDG